MRNRLQLVMLPLLVAASFILFWHVGVTLAGSTIFPKPHQVLTGMIELTRKGVLVKYVVASLFRVSAGFLLALAVGVPDLAPIFLIFLASLFPIMTATMSAVQNIQLVYLRAARNFGVKRWTLFTKVIFPAAMPQIITGVRIALGVAWLVVVAAEMIAVNSGLGYLIIDARNAGMRYDLVVAGMALIGLIGLTLDLLVRRLEHLDEVRWGFNN
jgi:NitT/TauT family transport system permease protein